MGKKRDPMEVIVHYPEDGEGWKELSRRAAAVHADAVNGRLQRLECPAAQKLELLEAVIRAAGGNEKCRAP